MYLFGVIVAALAVIAGIYLAAGLIPTLLIVGGAALFLWVTRGEIFGAD